MKVQAHLDMPDDVPMTLTITGTMEEWRKLRLQLDAHKWPSWQFSAALGDVIRAFEARADNKIEAGT